MTERALTRTLLNIIGLFWILTPIASLPLMLSFMLMPTEELPAYLGPGLIGGLVVDFAVGCLLLRYADALARRLAPADAEPAAVSLPSLEGFEAIAFGLFGLYFFVTGLSGLAKLGYLLLKQRSEGGPLQGQITDLLPDGITAAVEFAAGIALFFGGRRLARILPRLHSKQ